MCGGQAIDLEAVGGSLEQPQLELMHVLKTGALIRASVLLGALCGSLSEAEQSSLDRYAKTAGLLFQVVDDILDCTASTATLGKTAGKDAAHAKPTYVSLLGLDAAKAHAEDLAGQAREALRPFGERAKRLNGLTDFLIHRSF
jgi:farnesyl diphosphate synthase